MRSYYSIPFSTQPLIEKKHHQLCGLLESIQQNIALIIKTHYGDYKFNPSFGCLIWNKDYSTVSNVSQWKDELKMLIESAVEMNEPRVEDIKIEINIEEEDMPRTYRDQPVIFKKKIAMRITGTVKHIKETFVQSINLLFSPLSIG
jgi:phage baseplate assembly protein W